jgi:nitrate/nitrite transport system permease protein
MRPLFRLDAIVLPALALLVCGLIWSGIAGREIKTTGVDDFGDPVTTTRRVGVSQDLPTPVEAWKASKPFIVEPFAKRGEMDQGILRFAWLSLKLVLQGYAIALVVGAPLGFLLGVSKPMAKALDPIIEVLRPVSPLAWFPLGLVLFSSLKLTDEGRVFFGPSDAAALFTIAVCSMWPTVVNTAVGVRKVPQDYLNVARVLRLSKPKTLFKVLLPATMPYMFTGFRLSLGIAWLVIVAVEMLTGRPGVGGFIWQAYNAGSYAHIILCIATIGVIGFVLDRTMSVVEKRFKTV